MTRSFASTPLVLSFSGPLSPPDNLNAAASVTLTWTTAAGVSSAFLSGVGAVDVNSSTTVPVFETTVFELTVLNDQTQEIGTAVLEVPVTPEVTTRFVPSGTIAVWTGTATGIPFGWLLCDGSVYANATYPTLATVLGNAFGGSTGSSFAVPDFIGHYALGATGASTETAQSTGAGDMHYHSVGGFSAPADLTTQSAGSHSHQMPSNWYTTYYSSGKYAAIWLNSGYGIQPTASGGSHTHPVSISFDAFSSDTSGVEPPWMALCYIIKI